MLWKILLTANVLFRKSSRYCPKNYTGRDFLHLQKVLPFHVGMQFRESRKSIPVLTATADKVISCRAANPLQIYIIQILSRHNESSRPPDVSCQVAAVEFSCSVLFLGKGKSSGNSSGI